jgi:hypothetical protein
LNAEPAAELAAEHHLHPDEPPPHAQSGWTSPEAFESTAVDSHPNVSAVKPGEACFRDPPFTRTSPSHGPTDGPANRVQAAYSTDAIVQAP